MADLSIKEPLSPWRGEFQNGARLDKSWHVDGHTDRLAMILDGLTIVTAAVLAAYLLCCVGSTPGTAVWQSVLFHGKHRGLWVLLTLGFVFLIVFYSERLHLYTRDRVTSSLDEQELILKACLSAGFLPAMTAYLLHPLDIRTGAILATVALTTILLSSRRFAARILRNRQLRRGTHVRNIFIVGTGPAARALRDHLRNTPSLGYSFKGFVEIRGSELVDMSVRNEVIAPISTIFDEARRHFVDDIFVSASCDRDEAQRFLQEAPYHDLNVHLVPDLYDALAALSPIEFVGQFPTIPLYRKKMDAGKILVKRALDIAIATSALIALAPILVVLAILIKCDSAGPVLYLSDRVGRKGRIFSCFKFRTMVQDADVLRDSLASLNERDGVLFKVDNDPRVTTIGRVLRRYSLDELPQFLNVLRGEMSVVGPRPALASEVSQYKLAHLRRLDVTPGVTGLWQVQARRDPSFDRYISLDLTYVERWNIWLDLQIIFRTLRVVLAGTGS